MIYSGSEQLSSLSHSGTHSCLCFSRLYLNTRAHSCLTHSSPCIKAISKLTVMHDVLSNPLFTLASLSAEGCKCNISRWYKSFKLFSVMPYSIYSKSQSPLQVLWISLVPAGGQWRPIWSLLCTRLKVGDACAVPSKQRDQGWNPFYEAEPTKQLASMAVSTEKGTLQSLHCLQPSVVLLPPPTIYKF